MRGVFPSARDSLSGNDSWDKFKFSQETQAKTGKSIHYKGLTFERKRDSKPITVTLLAVTHTGFLDAKKMETTGYMESGFRF